MYCFKRLTIINRIVSPVIFSFLPQHRLSQIRWKAMGDSIFCLTNSTAQSAADINCLTPLNELPCAHSRHHQSHYHFPRHATTLPVPASVLLSPVNLVSETTRHYLLDMLRNYNPISGLNRTNCICKACRLFNSCISIWRKLAPRLERLFILMALCPLAFCTTAQP